ncbi:MAG: hypothetical protein JWR69_3621 [Pedosphaera sp.]|nr:hypothetical protein [Pedosphaera sp.]
MGLPEMNDRISAKVCCRALMAACLVLSLAVLWGESQRQSIQEVMHSLPLTLAAVCGLSLLILSGICFRSFGRLAVYGLLVGAWTLFVCLLPTL